LIVSDKPRSVTPSDGVAWIVGASSGIGRAVALELAKRGWTVAISARREEELLKIVAEAQGLKGRLVAFPLDVTDGEAAAKVFQSIEMAMGPVALAFFNAGIAPYIQAPDLDLAAIRKVLDVNLYGVFAGLAAVMPSMARRKIGQIAVTASVAGYHGLPRAAAYGSTKAAVIYLCEALKFDCDRIGIKLQVVNPGFVRTPLTDKNDFPMPTIISEEEAATRTVNGFEKGGFEIAYPKRLAWTLKLIGILPYRLYFWLVGRTTGFKG
jgi:NAD(P)-dependent dehydrogenase (short-subunit alcohol dehydrogenase family)